MDVSILQVGSTQYNIKDSTARSTANSAKSTAQEAKVTANSANSTAQEAKVTANSANSTAQEAKVTANSANSTAQEALEKSITIDYSGETLSFSLGTGVK